MIKITIQKITNKIARHHKLESGDKRKLGNLVKKYFASKGLWRRTYFLDEIKKLLNIDSQF